jgi:hypothetical protein
VTIRRYAPTPEGAKLARTHAARGIPLRLAARQLGICEDTLRRHYPEAIAAGRVELASEAAKAYREWTALSGGDRSQGRAHRLNKGL